VLVVVSAGSAGAAVVSTPTPVEDTTSVSPGDDPVGIDTPGENETEPEVEDEEDGKEADDEYGGTVNSVNDTDGILTLNDGTTVDVSDATVEKDGDLDSLSRVVDALDSNRTVKAEGDSERVGDGTEVDYLQTL
jgi:hypothetical protein